MPHPTPFGMTVTADPALSTIPAPPDASRGPRRRPAAGTRPAAHRVIIIDSPVPSYSPESPTEILADHLARRGLGVDVLTGLDVLPDVTPSPRERVAGLPPSPRSPHLDAGPAEGREPDLVIGMSDPDGDARAAARLARRTGARLLVVVTGLDRSTPPHVVRVLGEADRVIVPGESFRQALTSVGLDPSRITVLPTWSQSSPSWLDRSDARRRLGWPERAFIAVHSGPMTPDSGLEAVVDAAALLGPDCYVAVTGCGPLRPVVEARAAAVPRALVPAPMDAEQRALTHVAADVLVVTEPASSPHLTLPLELARCLSAGRPVIAAAPVSGALAAELSRTGGAGLVVPPGEPARLAGALLALHADPSHRVAMGLAAIAYADPRLCRDTVLSRFDLVVDATLEAPTVVDAAPTVGPGPL
jgi:glycosyltransferase involved in cell wall biosynthesis